VSEYALPEYDANANGIAIEHIKLENEGWERDLSVTEPTEPVLTRPLRDRDAAQALRTPSCSTRGTPAGPSIRSTECSRCCAPSPATTGARSRSSRSASATRCCSRSGAGTSAIGSTRSARASGAASFNEFAIDSAQLPSRPAGDAAVALVTGDRTVRARLPSSLDLAAVVGLDEDDAVRVLTERCVADGARLAGDDLQRLETLMSDAEALAALEITFACSACGEEASAPFDAPAFLWSDVDERCRGLLLDVDALASAYGWSEAQILALADRRRAAYVQLARG